MARRIDNFVGDEIQRQRIVPGLSRRSQSLVRRGGRRSSTDIRTYQSPSGMSAYRDVPGERVSLHSDVSGVISVPIRAHLLVIPAAAATRDDEQPVNQPCTHQLRTTSSSRQTQGLTQPRPCCGHGRCLPPVGAVIAARTGHAVDPTCTPDCSETERRRVSGGDRSRLKYQIDFHGTGDPINSSSVYTRTIEAWARHRDTSTSSHTPQMKKRITALPLRLRLQCEPGPGLSGDVDNPSRSDSRFARTRLCAGTLKGLGVSSPVLGCPKVCVKLSRGFELPGPRVLARITRRTEAYGLTFRLTNLVTTLCLRSLRRA